MTFMLLSVVIPTLKSPQSLDRLLYSLGAQELAPKIQVICVNNLPKFKRGELVELFSPYFYDFKYMNSAKIGANSARNTGLRFASGDIIYFVDDDCELPLRTTFLSELVETFHHYPMADYVGGRYLPPSKMNTYTKTYFELSQVWQKQGHFIGGNTAYRKSIFDQGLRFDSHMIFGGTEDSLNDLLLERGFSGRLIDHFSIQHNLKLNLKTFLSKAYKQGQGHSYLKKGILNDERYFIHDTIYISLFSLFFRIGHYSKLKTNEQLSFVAIEILRSFKITTFFWKFLNPMMGQVWLLINPIYWKVINPIRLQLIPFLYYRVKHYLYLSASFVVHSIYFLRNQLTKPFIKLYFVIKYHLETYVTPNINRILKNKKS